MVLTQLLDLEGLDLRDVGERDGDLLVGARSVTTQLRRMANRWFADLAR